MNDSENEFKIEENKNQNEEENININNKKSIEIKKQENNNNSSKSLNNINNNNNNNNNNENSSKISPQKTDVFSSINIDTIKHVEEMKKGTYSILVAVRCRPLNQKEKEISRYETINIIQRKLIILKDPNYLNNPNNSRSKHQSLAFDFVFDKFESQKQIFNNTTKFLIDGIINGFNATVFAYGATGSGKTYTMLGNEENEGIMPLTLKELFTKIKNYPNRIYNIKLCYLEIYNENIKDLLLNGNDNLDLREDPNKGIIINNITEIEVKSAEHILNILKMGNKNRTTESTNANETSSRSHAILQILVSYKEKNSGITYEIKFGKLSLIDLAGSERASMTQNQGIRLFEGANINRSLLSLGNCIKALCEQNEKGNKKIYVPFRDSKLTRLLKDSLGGNSRTVMIATISPFIKSFDDTYNTLMFANKAKNIKTFVKRNVLSAKYYIENYVNIIKGLQEKIISLEKRTERRSYTLSPEKNCSKNNNNEKNFFDTQTFNNIISELNDLCETELKLKEKIVNQQMEIFNKINEIKKDEKIYFDNNNNEKKIEIKNMKKLWETNLLVFKDLFNNIEELENKHKKSNFLTKFQKDFINLFVKNNKNKITNFDIKFKFVLMKNQLEEKNNYIIALENQVLIRDGILLDKKIEFENFSNEIKNKYKTLMQLKNEFFNFEKENLNNFNINNNNNNLFSVPNRKNKNQIKIEDQTLNSKIKNFNKINSVLSDIEEVNFKINKIKNFSTLNINNNLLKSNNNNNKLNNKNRQFSLGNIFNYNNNNKNNNNSISNKKSFIKLRNYSGNLSNKSNNSNNFININDLNSLITIKNFKKQIPKNFIINLPNINKFNTKQITFKNINKYNIKKNKSSSILDFSTSDNNNISINNNNKIIEENEFDWNKNFSEI